MLDVLVCCLAHEGRPPLSCYPQIRGYYLAKYLTRIGLSAEFRSFPCPEVECRVLICSEYQGAAEWLALLQNYLVSIRAEKLYCMVAFGLAGREHFSKPMTQWFGERGGVLSHLSSFPLEPYEKFIGVGVDTEVVKFNPHVKRNTFLFDFPASQTVQSWRDCFRPDVFSVARAKLRNYRFLGMGDAPAHIKDHFDEWVGYGQSHGDFVRSFAGCAAFVPGWPELPGLAVCEAQVAGACIVHRLRDINPEVLCPTAGILYQDGESLAAALQESLSRDPKEIAAQAEERFDFVKVAQRVKEAIGL
jgi:hypothetical protein